VVEIDRRFGGADCLHYHRPDDGGSKLFLNVGQFPQDYAVQHPRRQSSLINSNTLPISKDQIMAA
jgi:hypothetical protein